ncbi:hypothetical protein MAR_001585 [Mya arenaria]|uniref:Uncharacterized protein n=1 Tax=Mya arenaria TaxID=6604 RepID=A0ABY7FC73_MYAAR|nr:hypothetical protein MAR_001585 [Mya arenaria]
MILLYTDRQIDSINDLRVRFFIEKSSSNSLSIDPETLPPTSSATKYHSLRTYYQMLQWKGLDDNLCDNVCRTCDCRKLGLNCLSVCRYCDEACCNQLQLYNIE